MRYPGERLTAGDPIHWTGREQTWNYQCAECHSTDFRKKLRRGAERVRERMGRGDGVV